MNKLKDILYDKNDILVVLIILAIAALIISNRIDAILVYPQIVLAQDETEKNEPVLVSDLTDSDKQDNQNKQDSQENQGIQNPEIEKPAEAVSDKNDHIRTSDQTTAEPVNFSVYIESGSTGSKIAQTLIDCGLIKDKNEFFNAVTAANADSKLKAGTFTIPKGSTPAQIVQIITN